MDFKIKYETKILFSGNIIDHYFNLKFIPHDTAFQKVKNLEYSVTPNDFISKINTDLFQNYTSNDIISRLNDQGGNN